MQDIHAIGGGGGGGGAGPGGRLFAGGSGGADRRLRPHHNQNHNQALKCPRCDSLNTKFCYYNNYNLSQPRHFCKSCRRYWTKGGVLRNVPVGGGCRKTKRSKPKQTVSTDQVAAAAAATPAPGERNSNSHSSSESSSLTATTTSAKKAPPAGSTGEVASATVNSSNSGSNLMNFTDSRFFLPQMNPNGSFEHHQQLIDPAGTSEGQIFTEMGSFTSLMTASSNDPAMLAFTNMPTADISGYRLQQSHPGSVLDNQSSSQMVGTAAGSDELKMEQINCEFLDQTAQIGFSGLQQNRISNGGLSGLDWQINGGGGGGDGGGGEQGLFDFTGTVDQAYWGQNQWADNDQSLNFPPLV